MNKFLKYVPYFRHHAHYFSHRIDKEVNELFWQSLLASLSLSFIFIFEPIYLYTLGYGPIEILWFYVIVYGMYILTLPLGAKVASRLGYKHSILFSNILYVIYWIALFSIRQYDILFYIAPLFFALQKSFFWPAFNTDVALHNDEGQRGREVGVLQAINRMAFVVGPVVGGFISESLGFIVLFITAAILMMSSTYPLFRSPEVFADHEFSLKKFWQVFKEHKRNFFGYWGYAEDMMVMSLWPVFMFIVVPDFSDVGSITTIAMLVGTILMLFAGKLADKYGNRKLIRNTSILYGLTWMLRFLGVTTLGVLAFDILTRMSRALFGVPLLSLTYAKADGRGSDYALSYTVLFEFSVATGKVVTCLGGILILHLTGSILVVFVYAGLLTMMYSLLK